MAYPCLTLCLQHLSSNLSYLCRRGLDKVQGVVRFRLTNSCHLFLLPQVHCCRIVACASYPLQTETAELVARMICTSNEAAAMTERSIGSSSEERGGKFAATGRGSSRGRAGVHSSVGDGPTVTPTRRERARVAAATGATAYSPPAARTAAGYYKGSAPVRAKRWSRAICGRSEAPSSRQ